MAKSRKWIIFPLFIVLAVAAWYFWFGGHGAKSHRQTPVLAKPVLVRVVPAKWMDAQSFNEFAGTVQSSVTVQISSRIVAHIQELTVHAGMSVRKGDLLVRMDDGEIRARLKQAQSALAAAEATRDEAQKDVERYQDLVKSNIESRQKLDQMEARARNTLAGVEAAKEQIAEVKETLGYTEIRAPFDAVVVEKFAEPGDLAAPGRVLLTLQDPGRLRLEAPVSEQCARRIKVGDRVTLVVASAQAELNAKVSEIVPAIDPKSRSFLVRANLSGQAEFKPGMFGRLRFPCEPRKFLTVPKAAVATRGQIDFVLVVAGDSVNLRVVRLGESQQGQIEILSGLSDGEVVVVTPPENLRDGDPITIVVEGKQ